MNVKVSDWLDEESEKREAAEARVAELTEEAVRQAKIGNGAMIEIARLEEALREAEPLIKSLADNIGSPRAKDWLARRALAHKEET